MPLNDLIAQGGVQPIPPPNLLGQYGQMMSIQHAQNQNALAQYQMATAQRADQEANALRQALPTNFDINNPNHVAAILKASPVGGAVLLEKMGKVGKEQVDIAHVGAQTRKLDTDAIGEKIKQSRTMLDTVTTPDQYMAWHQANHADPILGKYLDSRGVTLDSSRAQIEQALSKPGGFEQLLNASKLGAEKALENHFMEMSSGQQKWTAAAPKYGGGAAQIVPGTIVNQVADPNAVLQAKTHLATNAATVGLGYAGLKQAANLPLQQNIAAAHETGKETARNTVVAQAMLPKIIADAEIGLANIDEMVGKKPGDKPHAGFETAVGATILPGLRFVHGSDTASFMRRLEQVQGGAFLQAYETLKGGGSITEVEGEKGTAAINRMATSQSEKEFIVAAREFQGILRKGVERAKAKAAGGAVGTWKDL